MSKKSEKTVSLVLGSGGARGLAHIGVIHWLEENGYRISSISGCSMGALIGGIYAAGKLDLYEKWVRAISKLDIVTLLDLSWDMSGLVKGDKIINKLIDLVGDQQIEDLPISFTAVATDLHEQKEVWINSGNLFDAIRASISLPLFFTPFSYKGTDLIDGGVLNPVPIAPTFSDETDLTIAVNLGGKIEEHAEQHHSLSVEINKDESLAETISKFIESFGKDDEKEGKVDLGMYDVANNAFDAMQSSIARQKLAAYPPDHSVEIAMNACGTLEFDRAAEMIALGYKKADYYLKEIIHS
jgi:NTE family protein